MTQQRKLLLVENDGFYIQVIETFVRLFAQLQIRSVKSKAEVLEAIREEHPDLLLLDLESEDLDMLELAERLRNHTDLKRLPILAISSDPKRREEALGRGCHAFLQKPFRVRELEIIITKLLE